MSSENDKPVEQQQDAAGAEGAERDPSTGTTLPFEEGGRRQEKISTVGEELRRERELREITLQEISEDTKISIRNLKAIEDNRFDDLPGGIYTKNFIRAYCRYLGINEEKMVNHYLYQTSPRAETTGRIPSSRDRESWALAPLPLAVGAVLLLLLIGGLVWAVTMRPAWFGFEAGEIGANRPPQGVTGASTAEAPGNSDPLDFRFRARADTWIVLEVDGQPRMNRHLKQGEYFPVTANQRIVLGIEDAGALEWTINGRPARSLGDEGQVVEDLVVGQQNWRQWLRAEPESTGS